MEDEEQGIVSAEATPAGCVTACHDCLPVWSQMALGLIRTGCFRATLNCLHWVVSTLCATGCLDAVVALAGLCQHWALHP